MSTRSTIAIELPNLQGIRKVYCHFDGYYAGVGASLMAHANTYEKALALIEGGDLSSFSKGVANHYRKMEGRENEPLMFPDTYKTFKDYEASIDHLFHEYNYIMRLDGKWSVLKGNYKKPDKAKWKTLKSALKKDAVVQREAALKVVAREVSLALHALKQDDMSDTDKLSHVKRALEISEGWVNSALNLG